MSDGNWCIGMLKLICVDGNKWTDQLSKDKRIDECKVAAIKHSFWAIDNLCSEIERMIAPRDKRPYNSE